MVQHSQTTPPPGRPKGKKLTGSLLALGAAAVVSVYTIGYTQTQPSVDDLTLQVPVAAATAATAPITAGGAPSVTSPTTVAAAKTQSGYVDGSYTGTGTSRHGNITATVVISGGKIASASISDCGTRYPCSDVNPLVSAVVSNQSVPTSNVSGATDSSKAYKTAVASALAKATQGV